MKYLYKQIFNIFVCMFKFVIKLQKRPDSILDLQFIDSVYNHKKNVPPIYWALQVNIKGIILGRKQQQNA